jgi:hypothetical protein
MSSPKMTRMFGLRPVGAGLAVGAPGAGVAFCACANASVATVAATSAVPLKRTLRRSGNCWFFLLMLYSRYE